ncbi:hypothetical protein CU097_010039 [Rhizopus azygosporus]|uniref:BHLH domain-containing protein n=1 Tax=Rhizopus azygosporus TaxID=86630 RepID=A0A367K9G6_RHIAZ|nr:hypothetical protein CU097_010039 [Rhizopus azygosporus]
MNTKEPSSQDSIEVNILQESTPSPIFLQQSDQLIIPFITSKSRPTLEPEINNTSFKKKFNRSTLGEDEKRENHVASEQKRRNLIKSRFKELTDLVPSLRDSNQSKSAVLFKAVEYIKHLEKRNKHLREKLESLQIRSHLEKRTTTVSYQEATCHIQKKLPQSTLNALMIHKQQQKQLEELQLKLQTQLLSKHHRIHYHSISIPTSNHAFIVPHQEDDQ